MKFQSEAAGINVRLKALIENQGCKIQVIKYDNVTEYTSDTLNYFYEEA